MARNKRDISFATFNLYNLNLPGQPIYNNAGGWTQDEFDRKAAWTADKLKLLDADVIGFQECWRKEALESCFEKAGLMDKYDIVARNLDPAGIQVALAARKGLLTGTPEWIDEFPQNARFENLREQRDAQESVTITIRKFSRPPLKVIIQPGGDDPKPPQITVYVAHLKSKGPSALSFGAPKPPVLNAHAGIAKSVVSHVRRIAEAGALRAILDTEMKDNENPFVVLGDMNDGTQSTSTELLTGDPGYRFFEKSTAGSKSDAGLYTVEKLQQLRSFQSVYYTHIFKQKLESLDHILVSDAFYDHAINRKWSFREMIVLNDHLVFDDKDSRTSVGANDHGIIRAEFDWNPMVGMLTRERRLFS
jgi:predicted extracellular nuclease